MLETLGAFEFFQHCFVYIDRHIRVDLSDDKQQYYCYLRTFAPIATVHLLSFKHAHLVETQQNIELMTFAVT